MYITVIFSGSRSHAVDSISERRHARLERVTGARSHRADQRRGASHFRKATRLRQETLHAHRSQATRRRQDLGDATSVLGVAQRSESVRAETDESRTRAQGVAPQSTEHLLANISELQRSSALHEHFVTELCAPYTVHVHLHVYSQCFHFSISTFYIFIS